MNLTNLGRIWTKTQRRAAKSRRRDWHFTGRSQKQRNLASIHLRSNWTWNSTQRSKNINFAKLCLGPKNTNLRTDLMNFSLNRVRTRKFQNRTKVSFWKNWRCFLFAETERQGMRKSQLSKTEPGGAIYEENQWNLGANGLVDYWEEESKREGWLNQGRKLKSG